MASPTRKLLGATATSGNSLVLLCFIEIGADLNNTDRNGQTALMRAGRSIKFMPLEHGSDLHIRDKED
jgi:hypothetical protein